MRDFCGFTIEGSQFGVHNLRIMYIDANMYTIVDLCTGGKMTQSKVKSRKALAYSVVDSHVGLTTTYTKSRSKLQNLVDRGAGKFVRVTNRNRSNFIAVQEEDLVVLIEECLEKASTSDVNPMFVNILSNPVNLDGYEIVNTRAPEINAAKLRAINLDKA